MWNPFRKYSILQVDIADATTDLPVVKAKVQATGYMSGSGRVTGIQGTCRFNKLRSGNYDVKVSHPDYFTHMMEIRLKPGERKRVDMVLSPRVFKGYVRTPSGEAGSNMLVNIIQPNRTYVDLTDAEGYFTAEPIQI